MLNRVSCSFPLVGVGRCDPGGWWGGVDLFWEGHDITPEGIPQYLNLRPGIVQPDVKLETGSGWALCVERVPLKSSVYMGNGWFSSSLRAL